MPDKQKNVVPIGSPNQSGGGNGGGELGERLARIENEITHLATKVDIESVKTLIAQRESSQTRWLIGIISIATVSLVAALIRTFL